MNKEIYKYSRQPGEVLTTEQIAEIEVASKQPVCYDEDCPKLSPQMEKAFQCVILQRNRYAEQKLKEQALRRCRRAIELGGELDFVLSLFEDLDVDQVRDMYLEINQPNIYQQVIEEGRLYSYVLNMFEDLDENIARQTVPDFNPEKLSEQICNLDTCIITLKAMKDIAKEYHTYFTNDVFFKRELYLIEACYEFSTRLLGPDHPFTLEALYAHKLRQSQGGSYQKAQELAVIYYETCKRVYGLEHEDTLNALHQLTRFSDYYDLY